MSSLHSFKGITLCIIFAQNKRRYFIQIYDDMSYKCTHPEYINLKTMIY